MLKHAASGSLLGGGGNPRAATGTGRVDRTTFILAKKQIGFFKNDMYTFLPKKEKLFAKRYCHLNSNSS